MQNFVIRILLAVANSLWMAFLLLLVSAFVFCSLAMLIKGDAAIAGARRAAAESRLNLTWLVIDTLTVAPWIGLLVALVRSVFVRYRLEIVPEATWSSVGTLGTFIAVIFAGDFASYWRHRLEHTRWLWPAHAIHHSDTEMTWLTLSRFHPVNRATTSALDIAFLAMLGFPSWALVANEILRNYYGQFIHADFPWTYGPLGLLFVSPAMHRWHHARDVTGAGSNFATVFSVFDRAFGTHYVPGPCDVPLGVTDKVGGNAIRQLVYPFVAWARKVQ